MLSISRACALAALLLVLAAAGAAEPLTIVSAPGLPTATVGVPYSQNLSASGGLAPYTWRFALGEFPYFFELDPAGVLKGTPRPEDAGRTVSIRIRVIDAAGTEVSQTFSISIRTAAPLVLITASPLEPATINVPYSARLEAGGGTQPYRWSSAGALPAGLQLDAATGVISGRPSAAGNYTITVTVTDAAGGSVSRAFGIAVSAPPLSISSSSPLPDGAAGVPYSYTFAAAGGTPPYTNWSALDALPGGLALSAAGGTLSGTPAAPGAYNIRIQVADAAGATALKTFALRINPAALLITTASPLPDGAAGASYTQAFSASGGTPPYTRWSALDAPPPGLSLSANGTLSGTPSAAGSYTFRIEVADSAGSTARKTFALRIQAAALAIATSSPLPGGTGGTAYDAALAASGGAPPYGNWSVVSGALPPGLMLSGGTGALAGTPATAGSYSFRVRVSDSAGATAEKNFALTIGEAGGLRITSSSPLPAGYVGVPYNFTFAAAGGTPPYRWRFPLGGGVAFFTLDAYGVLSGTPRASDSGQTYTFEVMVTDADGQSARGTFTISFLDRAQLTITTESPLPPATAGAAYTLQFAAAGGRPPYTGWAVAAGQLPPGLACGAGGALSGTPTAAGTYTFTLRVSDSAEATAQKSFELTVTADTLVITTPALLPAGAVGVDYAAPLAASGGRTPYRWTVRDGALPGGLALDAATGRIAGKPANAGTWIFTIEVSDAAGARASKQFTLTIAAAAGELIIVTPSPLPMAKVGERYAQTIQAAGGKPPYSWRFPLGESAAFLTIDAASGVLRGEPEARYAGQTLEFRLMVTDSAGQTALKRFRLLIVQPGTEPLRITTESPLPDGYEGLFYNQPIAALGGTQPYRWSVVNDADLPPGVVLDASTGSLYGVPSATGTFTFTIAVKDVTGAADQKTFELTVKPLEDVIPAGPVPPVAAPVAVAVDAGRGRVFFSNRLHYDVYLASGGSLASDAVTVLDTQGRPPAPIFVGKALSGDYQGIAVDSARRRVYVPNADDNSVSVIDPVKNTVIDTIYVGAGPTDAAVEPRSGTVYVTNSDENSVSVLDASGAPLATLSLAGKPMAVAVDRTTQRAYVLVKGDQWAIVELEGAARRDAIAFPYARSVKAIAVDPGARLYAADSSGQVYVVLLAGRMSGAGSFTAGDSPARVAVDSTTHRVYVTNFGSSTVEVYSENGAPRKSYPVLKGPTGIAIDEIGRKAYVADTLANSYSIIDLEKETVENSAPVGTINTGLAFDPVSRRLYAANLTGNAVSVIDPEAKKAVASWPCGEYPWVIAVDGDLQQVYTVNVNENAVAVLGAADGVIKKKIPLPESKTDSAFIAVNRGNHRVYVTQGSGLSELLTIIDGTRNEVVRTVRTGARPVGIAVDEQHGLIYVASINSGTITVLSADTEEIVATWSTGAMTPWALAVDPQAGLLYVTIPPNTPADFRGLLVLDAATGQALQQVRLGSNPEMVVANPATGHAFVSDPNDGTVAAVGGAAGKLLKVFPAGNLAYALAIDSAAGVVYLANGVDGTINLIQDSSDLDTASDAPARVAPRRR